MGIIVILVLGALAGFIASMIMGSSSGLMMNILLGIIGAFVGDFIMGMFGQSGVSGLNIYSILVSVLGAIIVIALYRIFTRRSTI